MAAGWPCQCRADERLLLATEHKSVDLADLDSQSSAIDWWTALTGRGGEGMVVKPLNWVVRGKKGRVQPAVKCRGREYLRIIYGPDYTGLFTRRVRSHGTWLLAVRYASRLSDILPLR